MEIHWHHTQWLSEDGREEIEGRIRELAEQGSNDIIDVRISGSSARQGHGEQEVRITCEARGKEIVAVRTSDSLDQALHDAVENFVQQVRQMRKKRRDHRGSRDSIREGESETES
ncbi:MAG: HPF/RaiA family ribosome-associated protein [Deltaproteobacteria bacterium]|nr:HPF/RaiA family ribosome-associated protein [Deltaproteobacteria bacterium]MBW2418822.1 HPF/RaiA family ribosome-associated protein [Deltaproteobacteria bacterium]